MKILLAEDDDFLADGISMALRFSGNYVDRIQTGGEAQRACDSQNYDVIVLDLDLPDMDGLELLQRLRTSGLVTPVLIVTARDAIDDRVRGLDYGANDYLVKPFHLKEFEARVRALNRVSKWSNRTRIRCGSLSFDPELRTATVGSERIYLAPREISVLELLLQRNGRIVTRDDLSAHLSSWDDDLTSNAMDIVIHRLRRKLRDSQTKIETHRGLGFSLRSDS
ncbi:MAG: response regulator transcription factor [Cyanobacteria bacterium]|nr:response regulator transcription factor [Cyanobacteriota bacterium]